MHREHSNLKVSRGGVAAKVDMTSPTALKFKFELLPRVSCTTSLLLRSGFVGSGLLSLSTQ
eukprot:4830641-Amphidinium_carterae.1